MGHRRRLETQGGGFLANLLTRLYIGFRAGKRAGPLFQKSKNHYPLSKIVAPNIV